MKAGLMYHVEDLGGFDASEVLDQIEEASLLADRLGFDEVWYAEHHFYRQQSYMPAPLILAAHVAARTERIRVGTAIIVLPINHPLRVAEEVAVLDRLSRGRLSVGFGSGASAGELAAYGVAHEERHARFNEAIEVILKAWRGEPFSHQGRFVQIPEVTLQPPLVQPVGELAWLGAGSRETAELAGRLGLGLMLPRGRPAAVYASQIEGYRAALGGPGRVSIARNAFVAETAAEARRIGEPAMRAFCRRFHPNDPMCDAPGEELAEKLQFILATPDACVAELADLGGATGMTHVSIQPNWNGIPHDASLRSIELMGREVLPRLRAL